MVAIRRKSQKMGRFQIPAREAPTIVPLISPFFPHSDAHFEFQKVKKVIQKNVKEKKRKADRQRREVEKGGRREQRMSGI